MACSEGRKIPQFSNRCFSLVARSEPNSQKHLVGLLTVAQKVLLQKAIRDFQQTEPFSPKTTTSESIPARKTRKHTVQVKMNNAVFGKENTNQYMTHKVVRSEIPFPSGQINTKQPHILKTS
ncbi:hypothetical protein CEXT_272601 [Caerostris extrusa]|uniref:Uncharacterized protein n=1 Tax=Caerostris extrusa TaxID=172846 RepID=A0AAV4SZY3_CAEEX|nr:hypothetical protein CEXT_272601 [Caerostris extrusa]